MARPEVTPSESEHVLDQAEACCVEPAGESPARVIAREPVAGPRQEGDLSVGMGVTLLPALAARIAGVEASLTPVTEIEFSSELGSPNKQRAQVRVASLGDAKQLYAPAGAALPRHQAQVRSKLPSGAKRPGISHRRHRGCCRE